MQGYPFSPAAWSLTFEAFANAVYACLARHLNQRVLLAILALGGAALVWLAFTRGGIAGGPDQADVLLGIPRVIFPFFAGVLLRRLPAARTTGSGAGAAMIVVLLAVLLAVCSHRPAGERSRRSPASCFHPAAVRRVCPCRSGVRAASCVARDAMVRCANPAPAAAAPASAAHAGANARRTRLKAAPRNLRLLSAPAPNGGAFRAANS